MKKESLKRISKEAKVDFLNKLQAGECEIIQIYNPAPKLNFDLIPETGQYKCLENGKIMSKDEIFDLPGYRATIELIRDLKEPASGFVLIPLGPDEYLNSLLRDPKDKYLNRQEAADFLSKVENDC